MCTGETCHKFIKRFEKIVTEHGFFFSWNMDPVSFSPSALSSRVTGNLAETDTVTVEQLNSARETFFDLETTYRKFKFELESLREEHRNEVSFNIMTTPIYFG